ncbi:MAG: T9SS type A sorting domain-containing protein [Lewinellaceae bacterium]|nr:T9SS type A sorting domain-containing protein [Lewinellaceae bacterium]
MAKSRKATGLCLLMLGSFFCSGPAQVIAQQPAVPQGLNTVAYEQHVVLKWTAVVDPEVTSYQVFRSEDGGNNYTLLKTVYGNASTYAIDWTGDEGVGVQRSYRLKAVKNNGLLSDFSNAVAAQTYAMGDEALLDMVQEASFRYFWDFGHPVSGLARERSNGNNNIVTTGGSGFGIMAILVGVERGWVSREDAVNRMIKIVSFLQFADRFHGVYPHWMNGTNGDVVPFSQFDNGADLVETAFLIQGLLAARQYFDQNTPLENAVRDAITGIWEDVEWDWFRKDGGPVLYWHWSPNYAWAMNFPLRGFYEAQIVYILAAASPTHGVPGSLYQSGWTANSNYCTGAVLYGHPLFCGSPVGGPLFWAHYSYLGFDPRNWKDFCCNYFVRNRNHSLIQLAYAQSNPENHPGYGANCWGLTACDGPNGYSAHDILPQNDDGTVAPTAALSSMPYLPAESIAALKYFYRNLGENLWGNYGFYDAFNEGLGWTANSYLAIDQGPIIGMIENYRSGLLWEKFMQNPEIEPALLACGFVPDNSGTENLPINVVSLKVYPNPVTNGRLNLSFSLEQQERLVFTLIDVAGKHTLLQQQQYPVGPNIATLDVSGLADGVYWIHLAGKYGILSLAAFQINTAGH